MDVNRVAAVLDEDGNQRFAPTLLPFAIKVEIVAEASPRGAKNARSG